MVGSDMGDAAAKAFGASLEAFGAITPLQSAQGVLEVVDKATKETHGGKFWDNTGKELTY
jgi:norsolorinic acid ketoreductase